MNSRRAVGHERLRIGVDAHVLDGRPQGSRTWLLHTLRAAIPQAPGIDWLVYTHSPESFAPFARFPNARHRPIPFTRASMRLGFFWPWALWRDRCTATLFQYHGPPVLRSRQLLTVHDLLFESHPEHFPAVMRWRLRLLTRHAGARALGVLVVSNWTQSEIIRRYRLDPARVFLAPNGLPERSYRPRNPDRRTVLFVGRIEPRKNLGLLLEAFDRMRTPGRRLVVIGQADPHHHGSGRVLARLQGREDISHLAGISDGELDMYYSRAAVLAFPSAGEGFGMPVLDALRAGTPVVASDRTAIPEVAGGFAALFDPGADDAVDRLAMLLDEAIANPPVHDPDLLATHLANFSWTRSAKALLDAISLLPGGLKGS